MAGIDLHLHTHFSDGSCSPKEVLTLAHEADLTTVSITDHDSVAGIPEALETASQYGIEVIPGIELSSQYDKDEIHLLGYFLNWKDSRLHERLSHLQSTRRGRNSAIIDNLNHLGISLSYEELQADAQTDSIGRPHIASLLIKKGYVSTVQEAFTSYLSHGASAFADRDLPDVSQAITWIREAGGIPVLAHHNWVRGETGKHQNIFEMLKEVGLAGIEVFYSTHTRRDTSRYLETARRLGLLMTGGSDFHGAMKPDIRVRRRLGNLKIPERLLEPLRNARTAISL